MRVRGGVPGQFYEKAIQAQAHTTIRSAFIGGRGGTVREDARLPRSVSVL